MPPMGTKQSEAEKTDGELSCDLGEISGRKSNLSEPILEYRNPDFTDQNFFGS